jgi:hypothetical protein
MYSSSIYLYKQTQDVTLLTPGTTNSLRYQTVYSKNLKLHKGVDNVLQFHFKNQDQVKRDLTGLTFTFRLISQTTEDLLLEQPLTIIDILKGYAEVNVAKEELDKIAAQHAYYSIEQDNGTLTAPVFVDEQAGGRGVCDIVESVYPKHKASANLALGQLYGGVQDSAEYLTDAVDLHTFQVSIDSFTGTMQIQGAVDNTGTWYNIAGSHPKLRAHFAVTAGTVKKVLIR